MRVSRIGRGALSRWLGVLATAVLLSLCARGTMADGEEWWPPPLQDDDAATETTGRRATCGRCLKPAKVCLCTSLPAEKLGTPRVRTLILQHPEEAGSAKSTVALLRLCLADCRVVTGRKFKRQDLPADMLRAAEQAERARAGIRDGSTLCWQRTLLLWPAPDAEPLEQVAPALARELRASAGATGAASGGDGVPEAALDAAPVLLVVLDGTWPSCGQMLQKSEILRGLRTVSISPPGECLYAIRMEPSPAARSTLEAVAHSIAVLEGEDVEAASEDGDHARVSRAGGVGEAVRDALLRVLLHMVELQCAHITNPKHRKVDNKHYRPNRYNISAVTPPHLRASKAVAAPLPSAAAAGAEERPKDQEGGEGGAVAPGGEGADIVRIFMQKSKNKTALLEHLVKSAQTIERVWDAGAGTPRRPPRPALSRCSCFSPQENTLARLSPCRIELRASSISDSACILLATRATAHTQAEPLARRYDLLAGYRQCLLLLGEDDLHDGDVDLIELARLGPKIKSLDFPLSHFLALVLPIERKYSKGLRDHEFLITTEDAGKPAARRSAHTGSQDLAARGLSLPVLDAKCQIIVDNLRSAFNVGSIFRTSECLFGSMASLVLTGYTATPEDTATRKSAMGMDQVVAWSWVQTVDQAIADAKAQGLMVVAVETVEGSPVAHDFEFPRQCALLLGNERHGVEPRHIALCDATVQIPCRGVKNSLNVATAFGICAYEMTRQWSLASRHCP